MFFSTKFFFPKGPPFGFFPKFLKFFQNFFKLWKLPYYGVFKVFKVFLSFFFLTGSLNIWYILSKYLLFKDTVVVKMNKMNDKILIFEPICMWPEYKISTVDVKNKGNVSKLLKF